MAGDITYKLGIEAGREISAKMMHTVRKGHVKKMKDTSYEIYTFGNSGIIISHQLQGTIIRFFGDDSRAIETVVSKFKNYIGGNLVRKLQAM